MITEKKKLHSDIYVGILFAVITVLNIVLCITHEMWRDEAQAWMIAKSSTLTEMYSFIWEEGHPCLLHVLFWIASRIGLPYVSMKYFALAITTAATAIVAFKSPFPHWIKYIWLVLPGTIYFLSSYARNYCLLYLIAVCVAALWKYREKCPAVIGLMIGLLASTHLLAWVPAYCLAVFFIGEQIRKKKVSVWSIITLVIPLILFCAPLIPQFTVAISRLGLPSFVLWGVVAAGALVTAVLLCIIARTDISSWNSEKGKKRLILISAAAILGIILADYGVIYLLVKSSASAGTSYQHIYSVIVMFVSGLWIAYGYWDKEALKALTVRSWKKTCAIIAMLLVVVLITEPINNYVMAFFDILYNKSEGYLMSEYIEDNIPADALIVTDCMEDITSVTANLKTDRGIYYPTYDKELYYAEWYDGWDRETPMEVWVPVMNSIIAENTTFYILEAAVDDYDNFDVWTNALIAGGIAEIVYQTPNYLKREEWLANYDYYCLNNQAASYLSFTGESYRLIKVTNSKLIDISKFNVG